MTRQTERYAGDANTRAMLKILRAARQGGREWVIAYVDLHGVATDVVATCRTAEKADEVLAKRHPYDPKRETSWGYDDVGLPKVYTVYQLLGE